MKRSTGFFIATALFLTVPVAQAISEADYQRVSAPFSIAVKGGAVSPALEAIEPAVNKEPTQPLLAAMQAALTAMKSRDVFLPWSKLKLAEEGCADMDRALGLIQAQHEKDMLGGVPIAMHARLIAASTFSQVPGFMNRGDEARRLIKGVANSPALASAAPAFRVTVAEHALKLLSGEATPEQLAAWRGTVAGAAK